MTNEEKNKSIIDFCVFLIHLSEKLNICPEPLVEHCLDVRMLIDERDFYREQYLDLIHEKRKGNQTSHKNATEMLHENSEVPKHKGFWLV